MSEATSSTLSVAITCDRTGYLSKSEADTILELIRKQVLSESESPDHSGTPGPTFSSEEWYEDLAIKVWCANDQSLTWLKKTVSGLNFKIKVLVVKSQSEIQKRVRCKFEISALHLDSLARLSEIDCLKKTLCYQNPWIDMERWALSVSKYTQLNHITIMVMMEIPEDQILPLMKAGCRLSIALTVVYVKFEGSYGEFNSDVPNGWDPVTKTIVRS